MQRRMVHCDAYLAILWVAFAFQVAFMAVTGWAWRAKAIHNFRVRCGGGGASKSALQHEPDAKHCRLPAVARVQTSLWALAAVATALACHSNFLLYLLATKTTVRLHAGSRGWGGGPAPAPAGAAA